MDGPLLVQSIAIFLRSIQMYMCMNEPFWQVSLIMDFLQKANNAKVKVKYYFAHM